jgi:hypothetical protein
MPQKDSNRINFLGRYQNFLDAFLVNALIWRTSLGASFPVHANDDAINILERRPAIDVAAGIFDPNAVLIDRGSKVQKLRTVQLAKNNLTGLEILVDRNNRYESAARNMTTHRIAAGAKRDGSSSG